MVRYIIRRLLWVVVLLVLVSFLTFIIFYTLPSADPAELRAGRQPNPELVEQIRENLGLSDPWYQQYFHYMEDLVLHFDFGYSYQNNYPVKDQIFDRLPASISVAIGAAVIWLLLGIAIGVISAVRSRIRARPGDDGAGAGRDLGAGLLARPRGPLPVLGRHREVSSLQGCGQLRPVLQDPWLWFRSLIMPWFVLAAAFAAFYARLVRGSMIEVMSEDYIRTARAKGLRERRVIFRHGLRSAITPVVTAAGLDIGILLGGTILVETVFNIPGVGRLAYDSIVNADMPMIQGTVLIGAFFIIMANLVVDMLYAFLDPRVRY